MTIKRITRSDKATLKGGIVSGVDKAGFISLVGVPANQRAFSILRSDQEEKEVSNTTTRVKRTRRSDSDNLVQLTFPESYTAAQAEESLSTFGLVGYKLVDVDGVLLAQRSDLQSIATDKLTSIKLTSDGITADVVMPEGSEPTTAKSGLQVPYIEFSSETFSRSDVVAWLEENKVDFTDEAIDNSTGNFVLKRSDAEENAEVRLLELSKGVTAAVVRADTDDIPEGYVEVISETAYCGWGWGQLDFGAKLADVQVGDQLREGLYAMEDVLRNILYHSGLPVESRKQLVNRTLAQFGAYASSLLDLLPRQLLVSVTGSVSTQRNDTAQEPDMTGKTTEKTEQPKDDEVVSMTRSELKAFIAEAVQESQAAGTAPAATETVTDAPTTAEQAPAASAGLTRSDLEDMLKPLAARLEEVAGTTIVRSDAADPEVPAAEKQEQEYKEPDTRSESVKRADKVFGNLNLFGRR